MYVVMLFRMRFFNVLHVILACDVHLFDKEFQSTSNKFSCLARLAQLQLVWVVQRPKTNDGFATV